jgi:hypothetical protein
MKLASALAIAVVLAAAPDLGVAASKTAPHSQVPFKTVVESAWAAALRPEHATGGTCASKIGKGPAGALAKYCMYFAPTLHARCNSGNTCQRLTDSIYGYCTDLSPTADPQVKFGGEPDPKHLPCVNQQKTPEDWEQIHRDPAW